MIKNYFKIALRNLWGHKGFSFLNIAGLAIGLTASFLILLYVVFELSYDNFHTNGNNIYRVIADIKTPSEVIELDKPAWAVPPQLEKEFEEIEAAVRIMSLGPLVQNGTIKYQETNMVAADSEFFNVFDFKLLQGNQDNVLKEPYTIVLSETTAKKYFGNENPIGQTLLVSDDELVMRVTGIMEDIPENSHLRPEIVQSLSTFTESLNPEVNSQWGNYGPAAYVLLNSNTDQKQLEAKFQEFMERNNGEDMKSSEMFVTLFLEPFKDVYLRSSRGGNGNGSMNNVYIFSIVAIFILLIACINFINLTTARSVERAKEVGIRKVIGAERGQLSLQFIGESVIISFLAFILTVGLATLILPVFNDMAGKIVSDGILTSPVNVLILFGSSLVIGILAGIYPSFVLSSFKPVSVLKGSFATSTSGTLLRKGLVIAQFTISITLIIGTIIIYNQMNFMRNQELGFNKEQMVVLEINSSPTQISLQHTLDNLPGVLSTSLGSAVPGGENNGAYSEIENKIGEMQVANLDAYFVDYDYLSQFNLKVLAGRGFSKDFATDSTQAMVVNEKAVQLLGYSSPEDAIGAKYNQWGSEGQIVGVVKDFHFRSLQQNIPPLTIRMNADLTNIITVKISPDNIQQTLASIESSWQNVVPDTPFSYYFLDEFFDRQYRTEERFGNLFLNFAALAIFISCLGLLGLAAYSTLQRKKEIGIRKVIGSSIFGIVNLLAKDFIRLVGISFLIASPIAWFLMNSWLKDFAYRIDIQWWMFAIAGLAAMLIAVLTVSFHALKASLANPVKSLRTE